MDYHVLHQGWLAERTDVDGRVAPEVEVAGDAEGSASVGGGRLHTEWIAGDQD